MRLRCRVQPGMEPQPLSHGLRVRSNSLVPSDTHISAAPSRLAPKPYKTWGGPFLNGDGGAAAVTSSMAGGAAAGMMMDSATANAFMAALAARANADPHFAAHVAMN